MDLKKTFNEMSVLSPLLTLYTISYLALMIYDFAAKDQFNLPAGMMAVYVALIGAYAADKEIRRWIGKEEPSRKGSLFVYLWLGFFLVAYIIRSFNEKYLLPDDLTSPKYEVI